MKELNLPPGGCQEQRPVPRSAFALGALLLALGGSNAGVAATRVIDRVVAVVGGQVLTLSELRFEARVMLVERGAEEAATAPLDTSALRSALELAIDARAAGLEADKLGAFAVDEADVEERVRGFAAHFRTPAAFGAFLVDNDADRRQLAEILARQIRAERFIDSKVRLRAQVSEADVRQAYVAQPESTQKPYESVRAQLREQLVRVRYGVLARDAVGELRASVPVRVVAGTAELAEGAGR